eukprot:2753625-Prymnesium_polylepis.2
MHASSAPLGRRISHRRAKGGRSSLAILRQRAGGATSASLTHGAAALCTLTGAANPSTVRRMWHRSLRVDRAASGERAWDQDTTAAPAARRRAPSGTAIILCVESSTYPLLTVTCRYLPLRNGF